MEKVKWDAKITTITIDSQNITIGNENLFLFNFKPNRTHKY